MKPELGDRVQIKQYFLNKEGLIFKVPSETSTLYNIGLENGTVTYAEEHEITILFRPEYRYVTRGLCKVGDLVDWEGERCLVVGLVALGEYAYQICRLQYKGAALTFAREQDLSLVHAAEHPEVVVAATEATDVEPAGWWGYNSEVPMPPAPPVFTEADDDDLPF